jgi:hypothetical protein
MCGYSSPWSSALFIRLRRRLQAASAEWKGDLYSLLICALGGIGGAGIAQNYGLEGRS